MRWKKKPQTTDTPPARSVKPPLKISPTMRSSEPSKPKIEAPVARPVKTVKRKPWGLVVGVLVAIVGLGVFARIVFIPGYIKSSAISAAAAHGVDLTVDGAGLSSDGVILTGLKATLSSVPQVSISIGSATAALSWSAPAHVTLNQVEIAIDGDARTTLAALDTWWKAHHTAAPPPSAPGQGASVEIPSAHLVWKNLFGTSVSRLEMSGLSGSIIPSASLNTGDELHFVSSQATVDTRVGRFGPWNIDVEQSITGRRARVAFDPSVLDGAGATLLLDARSGTTFDLDIPHLPSARLGVPATALGTTHPLPQIIEAKIHYSRLSTGMITSSFKTALFGARVPLFGSNTEVHLAGTAAGMTGTALPVKDGVVSVGPVRALVTGTVVLSDYGGTADLAWRGDPLPCASLVSLPKAGEAIKDATEQVSGNGAVDLGALVRDMGGLATAIGAIKVTGTFSASGTAVIDSSDLSRATFTTTAKNACGLALFQSR